MTSNIAFSSWKNRIAPVFDVSRSVWVVEMDDRRMLHQFQAGIADDQLHLKASRLAALHIDVLVCGAISRPLQKMITDQGISVIPFVAGDLKEVIRAWISGDITNAGDYRMPGCRKGAGHRNDVLATEKEKEP